MPAIDLNCDMGEGCANDAELMAFISSANIACGYHAGDVETMRRTVELAQAANVAIGAHPGYKDREGFGRREMLLSPKSVFYMVQEQIEALMTICKEFDAIVHHIKPHGGLYNQAAKDKELAAAIAESVRDIDDSLIVYGLSGSMLISEAEAAGLATASEVFADRTYTAAGFLTPRSEPNALITDLEQAASQVMQMVETGSVLSTDGQTIKIKAETVCIHGDGPHALSFARAIRSSLDTKGIRVRAS